MGKINRIKESDEVAMVRYQQLAMIWIKPMVLINACKF